MNNDDKEEQDHWEMVMRTFLHYQDFVEMDLERRQQHLNRLPLSLAEKLPEVTYEKLSALHNASKVNQIYFNDMVYFHATNTCFDDHGVPVIPKKEGPRISVSQQHRNQAVLHSLYREWSKEGLSERTIPFQSIIGELKRLLPVTSSNAYKQRVLVPGCGTGRLPVDIASHGYACEGNEFSAFMAIASNFVLNGISEKNAYDISPWLETVCNVVNVSDTLASVSVPDVPAIDILNSFTTNYPDLANAADQQQEDVLFPRFSMSCGDFCDTYGNDPKSQGAWDCVVTCFFVDTAPVVLDYVEVINRVLKPGGVWINLGPLLYHWVTDAENNEDPRYQQSIELSYEELRCVIAGYGFEFLKEEPKVCTYTRNPNSMMWTVYKAMLFSARKPLSADVKNQNN